ncbi:hypothetical protein RUND412_008469 [Rhizina undulata]
MSEDPHRSEQRQDNLAINYNGFAPFGFGSQPDQPVPLHHNQAPFRNYLPVFFDVVPEALVLRSQAVPEQDHPLEAENAALDSSPATNTSIDNSTMIMLPTINLASSPSMNFMHTQQAIVAPPPHMGGFYNLPARQSTNAGIPSSNPGNFVAMNSEAAFSPRSAAVMPMGATPLLSNVNSGDGTQSSNSSPVVTTPSVSPTANAGATRSKSRRHRCRVCGSAFSKPSVLKIHAYIHTGERPFKCTYEGCNEDFTTNFNLKRHMNSNVHEKLSR